MPRECEETCTYLKIISKKSFSRRLDEEDLVIKLEEVQGSRAAVVTAQASHPPVPGPTKV